MIEKEAFNELCLHSKFKLMRKILENYIINWKVAGQNWYIVCLGSNGFIAEINPYLQNKKTKTFVNLLNCIYNSFFLYITLTIFVWALFLFSQISKETRRGKQQLRRINPGRCSGDVALQEGSEPPSASVRSFIWQTHQGQETTPCLRPFSRGQEKTRFQTNVPQDGAYPPHHLPPARQQRGWGGSQTQARDTTGRFTDP